MSNEGGIFSDVNFDEGSDNPFGLEKGEFDVVVSDAKIERSEKGNLGLWVTFSAEDGKSIRKWTTMPEKDQDDDTRKRNTSFLRLLLRQLGVPESRWDSLDTDDLIGTEAHISVVPQKDSDYFQVKKISTNKPRISGEFSSGIEEFAGGMQERDIPAGGGFPGGF